MSVSKTIILLITEKQIEHSKLKIILLTQLPIYLRIYTFIYLFPLPIGVGKDQSLPRIYYDPDTYISPYPNGPMIDMQVYAC